MPLRILYSQPKSCHNDGYLDAKTDTQPVLLSSPTSKYCFASSCSRTKKTGNSTSSFFSNWLARVQLRSILWYLTWCTCTQLNLEAQVIGIGMKHHFSSKPMQLMHLPCACHWLKLRFISLDFRNLAPPHTHFSALGIGSFVEWTGRKKGILWLQLPLNVTATSSQCYCITVTYLRTGLSHEHDKAIGPSLCEGHHLFIVFEAPLLGSHMPL